MKQRKISSPIYEMMGLFSYTNYIEKLICFSRYIRIILFFSHAFLFSRGLIKFIYNESSVYLNQVTYFNLRV